MTDWTIQPLDRRHDRTGFTSGSEALDDFLRARVMQYEKRRLGKTFVATPIGGTRVIGYVTLAAGAVAFENLPGDAARKLPAHPVPVVLLARLAVDIAFQGRGIGKGLLLEALERAVGLSDKLGVWAVEVVAIDAAAVAFYRKYGFTPLLDSPRHLFLPIETVRKVLT